MSQSTPQLSYSTLEVSGQDPETYQKEVVVYPDHSYPQAVPLEQAAAGITHSYYSPESAKEVVGQPGHLFPPPVAGAIPAYKDPSGAVAYQSTAAIFSELGLPPSSTGSPIDSSVAYGQSPLNAVESGSQYPPSDEKAAKTATICGLPRRTFFIVLLIAIVVIIVALVGGIAGGLASKGHNVSAPDSGSSAGSSDGSPKDPASSGATNGTDKLILSNSKITASNWTDASGVVHRTVFFQDVYNSIVARRWDSEGKSWKTNNLTQLMAATTTPLNPQRGTPLASASMDLNPTYETHVWFADPRNIIRSMASFDALNRPDSWENDTLSGAILETWPGGQLAAAWQRGWDGDGEGTWIVAYQRPEGAIKTANSSTWASATVAVESKNVAANSSLAVLPKLRGTFLNRFELVSETVSGGDGVMRVTSYDDTWDNAEQRVTELLTDIPTPAPSQQFAATRWDNWNQALYVALLRDGTLQGKHFDGKTMSAIDRFDFLSGPEINFTAIAMSPDAMFYGISNSEILEYALDQADPSKFNYVGRAFP
ncbi:hypothetical protein AAE478_006176 [Parahypoxylon ruwenzoriense]